MKRRALLLFSFLSTTAFAQIQVFQFDGVRETAAAALVDVGPVAPGDTLETRFRVRNTGSGPAALQTLSLRGEGFNISAQPSLPYTIAPGAAADFRVTFSPSSTGTFSAFLVVNAINITLRGTSIPAATVMLAGSKTPLIAGGVTDFGSALKGTSALKGFTLFNAGSSTLTIGTLAVSGSAFRGPIGLAVPVQLAPGQTASFQVAFEPKTPQPAQGTLTVDQRSFNLTGLGLDPPLPAASIAFSSSTASSAQQNNISIPLAAASEVNGTGTVTMEFRSSVTGVADDAAIQFLWGPKRAATVTIAPGDTAAKFGTQSSIAFQTGTTAGTITFTLKLGNSTRQTTLTIAPVPVNIDTAHAVRRVNDLDVSIIGFDNTYSISQLAFTFYDKSGATMQPGVIRVDATNDFKRYFAATTTGGAFGLLATFPVSGDAAQVGGVEVQLTNSAGLLTTQRILFP